MMIPGVNGSILASAYKASKLKRRYEEGGPINTYGRVGNISPKGDVDYNAGVSFGPVTAGVEGSTNIPNLKQNYLQPMINYNADRLGVRINRSNLGATYSGDRGFVEANRNLQDKTTSVSAGLFGGRGSVSGDVFFDKSKLVDAGVRGNLNITPNLSAYGDIRKTSTEGTPNTSYNVGLSYKKTFQDGGTNPPVTKLSPQEEEQFNKFFRTLPLNLRVDNNSYDVRGYWDALGRPDAFNYNQPKEDDGMYHAFSRHPRSGKMLKSMSHPTAQMAIEGDKAAGYSHAMDPTGNVYSFSPDDMPTEGPYSFKDGGTNPPKSRREIYQEAEKEFNRQQEYMKTPEYTRLLQTEFYGPESNQDVQSMIEARQQNLGSLRVDVPYMSRLNFSGGDIARYDPNYHQIKLKKDKYDKSAFRHELSHSLDSSYTPGADKVGDYFSQVIKADLAAKGKNPEDPKIQYIIEPTEVKARLKALRDSSIDQGYKILEPGYNIEDYKEGFSPLEKAQYKQLKDSGFTDKDINKYMYLFAKEDNSKSKVAKKGARLMQAYKNGGKHGGLDRWFAEKWIDVKTGKACGRQEGEDRAYPACRPSKRVSSDTPKTASEMSPSEKAKFKSTKTSSQRIPYNHKRK